MIIICRFCGRNESRHDHSSYTKPGTCSHCAAKIRRRYKALLEVRIKFENAQPARVAQRQRQKT